jgi:exoribonuclease-2
MTGHSNKHRFILESIARKAMLERGLLPDFSIEALQELEKIQAPAQSNDATVRDLRGLKWASIDNDDSLDLDQLTVAEELPGDRVKVWVAVADVDSLVKEESAIDEHARHNTTSVYTTAAIFPMIPEKLSTNFTSLNFNEDRLAVVVEMVIDPDGAVQSSAVYRAKVSNHAKLTYRGIAAWLDGSGPASEGMNAVEGLAHNLRVQDRAAQRLKNLRHLNGALSLETIEAKPVFDGDEIRVIEVEEKNRAREIIEDFMIAANGVTARYLSSKKFPSLRRVVRVPKRWERIVEIAKNMEPVSRVFQIQKRLRSSWSKLKKAILCDSLTYPWQSSSYSVLVNTSPNCLKITPRVTLVWLLKIIHIRQLRIDDFLIWLPSGF